jgi:hypothetical protein
MFKTTTIALLLLATACGVSQPDNDGDGETGGDSKPNQGPPEVEHPPEWHCRNRIPNGTMVLADEGMVSAHASEVCPFGISTHHADPIPGKPNTPGLPDVASAYKAEWLHETDPNVPLGANNHYGGNGHPIFVEPDYNLPRGWALVADGDLRSGLIGNFAVWESVSGVPDSGLRPPVVTSSFADVLGAIQNPQIPTTLGDPLMSGRYNGWGFGCSTKRASDVDITTTIVKQAPRQEDAECTAWVIWDNVGPVHGQLYPYMSSEHVAIGEAVDSAECLDNGGEYHPVLASPSALVERQGLVWLNWDQLTAVQAYVQVHLAPLGVLEELNVFLDFLESLGFEYNYWPSDPLYPYARWSFTGVCAHPVELRAKTSGPHYGSIRTTKPCPLSYLPVLPDIEFPDLDDEVEVGHWVAEGYCTLVQALPPGPGMAGPTAVPEITVGKPGHGFSGAIYLERPTDSTFARWAKAVELAPDRDGIVIKARDQLGREILQAVNVPDGSRIVGSGTDVTALGIDVGRTLLDGRISMVILDTPDGRRLHRYVVLNEGVGIIEAARRELLDAALYALEIAESSTGG